MSAAKRRSMRVQYTNLTLLATFVDLTQDCLSPWNTPTFPVILLSPLISTVIPLCVSSVWLWSWNNSIVFVYATGQNWQQRGAHNDLLMCECGVGTHFNITALHSLSHYGFDSYLWAFSLSERHILRSTDTHRCRGVDHRGRFCISQQQAGLCHCFCIRYAAGADV